MPAFDGGAREIVACCALVRAAYAMHIKDARRESMAEKSDVILCMRRENGATSQWRCRYYSRRGKQIDESNVEARRKTM